MKIYGYAAASLSAMLMIASCANQAPPSGGPEDKTPPRVSALFPENGRVNVDTKVSIEIRFSEWINRSSAAGAVSVYPALPQGVAVRVKNNRLTVTPKAPLLANTTYRVSVAAIKDLRGNAISRPIDLVFSTGAGLDSGRVDGAVVALKSKAAGYRVMLFRADSAWTDGRYFSQPDYAALSDSAGAFGFSHIKEGRYRIVAFADQYRTGRLRAGDTCFTSLEKTVAVAKSPQTIRLYPAGADTSTVKKRASVDSVGVDAAAVDTVGVGTPKKRPPVDTAALCIRLSGGASCLEPDEKRKWVYRPVSRRDTSFTVADSAGTFAFDSIPASKGTLLWFIDDDGDNRITPGRLSPWRSPERFFVVPDTVEAKARWVIEGLDVRGCEEPNRRK